MENRQSDADEEKPPLPSIPPPSFFPSPTLPSTPATPYFHKSSFPLLSRMENERKSYQVEQNKVYCRVTLKKSEPSKLSRNQSITDMSKNSSSDSFLDNLRLKNLTAQTYNEQNEFNLDLDNFSLELMSLFEDLDSKFIARQRSSDNVNMELLAKGFRQNETSAIQATKHKVDSENYIVTNFVQNHQTLDALNSSKLNESGKKIDSLHKMLVISEFNEHNVRERAMPSPNKKFEREVSTGYHGMLNSGQPKVHRSLTFSSHFKATGQLPKTIVNQSYQPRSPNKKEEKGSNINYITNDFRPKHQNSIDLNIENTEKNNVSSCECTNKTSQLTKYQKSGFQNFCSCLKQRSRHGRNIYRQYMKQVIDRAPKLDGYESDASRVSDFGEGNDNFSERFSTLGNLSSVANPEITPEMKLSDGIPVNIFGTIRNSQKQRRGVGNAFKNIRNVFNIYEKQGSTTPVCHEYHRNNSLSNNSKVTCKDAKNELKTEGAEVATFLNNDVALKHRTCFQSLLNIFNSPEINQTSWQATIEKGKLRWEDTLESRMYTSSLNFDSKSWSYGSLNSSKRFVSCLEIRLGK